MDNIVFNEMDSEGHVTHIKTLSRETIGRCPSLIFLPSHYRDDGTCRHDEPNCEEDGCTNLKYADEIFCKPHLQENYGEYLEDEEAEQGKSFEELSDEDKRWFAEGWMERQQG